MSAVAPDLYDDVAYCFDGTTEGLLSAVFTAFSRREDPRDVVCEKALQPRLSQHVSAIETNAEHAARVTRTLQRLCGKTAYRAVLKASLADNADAGTAVYRFVRHALRPRPSSCERCRHARRCADKASRGICPRHSKSAFSDIAHPAVAPLFELARSVDNECERMRQFIRFEHLQDDRANIWFARCNPRHAVVPLVMGHFVERLGIQPFIIYDENHLVAGVYDGAEWYLAKADETAGTLSLPPRSADEQQAQRAWKTFYRSVSIESRYNPELRRQFMPKRLWRNLVEMAPDIP